MKKLWTVLSMVVVLALATTGFAFASGTEPQPGNIIEVALAVNQETGEFSTLIAAVTCPYFGTSLVDMLSRAQRTVFAPTDAAFAELGLNPENVCTAVDKVTLKYILFYHITRGKLDSGAVVSSDTLEMLNVGSNRQYADVEVKDGNVFIDGQKIIAVDVMASNGYIHVIDGVMSP
jgi:uncharacterized surface protein with fasciclin (FAS1) repeats